MEYEQLYKLEADLVGSINKIITELREDNPEITGEDIHYVLIKAAGQASRGRLDEK